MKKTYIPVFSPAVTFLFAGLLFYQTAFSQALFQWVKFFDDPPNSQNLLVGGVAADDLGSVYVTGYGTLTNNFNDGTADYVTVKYNASGTQEWVARYDGFNGVDRTRAIVVDKWGNVYVTGESERSAYNSDYVTIKYNRDGVQQWLARFNGRDNNYDAATDLKVDDNGNVYVTGLSLGSTTSPDIATVKYNSAGVQQWVQYYNGPDNNVDAANAIALDTATKDVYVTGYSDSYTSGGRNFVTVKYNNAGVFQWARFYNSSDEPNTDVADHIAVDAQGNIYVGGNSLTPGNVHSSVTIKYNAAGEQQWVQRFIGAANIYAQQNDMAIDKSGNVYIAGGVGYYFNGQAITAAAVVKYNSNGVQEWVQLNDTPSVRNEGQAIAIDDKDNIYLSGTVYGEGDWQSTHFAAIKYDKAGVQKWIEEYDPTPGWEGSTDIAVNRFYDVFVTGTGNKNYGASEYDYDYVTVRYSQPKPLVVKASPDTTVYYGYGSNCVQLSAQISGGVTPYSLKWSSGGVNISSTWVCPLVTTVYTATAKDVNGFTATSQVTVKVVDVRCDTKNNKIVVCHNGKELCLAANAVAAHLKHGDVLGSCIQGNIPAKKEKEAYKMEPAFAIYPNPVQNTSTVYYSVQDEADVTITLMDATGREMKTIVQGRKLPGSYTATINANHLAPGIYMCRMTVRSPGSPSVYVLKVAVSK